MYKNMDFIFSYILDVKPYVKGSITLRLLTYLFFVNFLLWH